MSFTDSFKELKNIPKNFFYINNAGNFLLASILERFLYHKGGRKIAFQYSPEIELNLFSFQKIKNYVLRNNLFATIKRIIFMLIEKTFSFISKKDRETLILN